MIKMIWAQSLNGVIGDNGNVPWSLPEDIGLFRRLTLGHKVVMGRKTRDSLPVKPLDGRQNIVISSIIEEIDGAEVFSDPEAVLGVYDNFWVIGGGEIYKAFMPFAQELYVTTVQIQVTGDTYAPEIGPEWEFQGISMWDMSADGLEYIVDIYERLAVDESLDGLGIS